MIKAIQVGLAALRFIAPMMVEAEGVFGKGTGANKLAYVLRQIKLAFRIGSDMNAIGEGDATNVIDKIDTVFTPAIDEIVTINNEFQLWDGFKRLWSGVSSIFGGADDGPLLQDENPPDTDPTPIASGGGGDVPG